MKQKQQKLECGPMTNAMATLSNIGGVLPQSLACPLLELHAVMLPRCETRCISWGAPN